jgi:5-hydroxyisourate hydrolase-like protein (transthyretin family)
MTRNTMRDTLTLLAIFSLGIAGCGRQGAPKYKVTGSVTVNGKPAAGMVVRFVSSDESLVGQDRQPVAVAGPDGRFELSSFGGNDGAAAGEYAVTFFWPANLMTMDRDRLQGKFADPKTSSHRVTVPAAETELPPFALTVPADQLLKGDGDGK